MRKSWREKLDNANGLPKVMAIPPKMRNRWGTGTLVIPAPREVDAVMKKVPAGKLITINEIRTIIAQMHQATIACPITTGIFAWIAAHAAEEARAAGAKRMTPYWRTLKSNGQLNPRYPGGLARLKELLRREGHRLTAKGKGWFVVDYEDSLWPSAKQSRLSGLASQRRAT